MLKPQVFILEFNELYNILEEIKNEFNFDIINFKSEGDFSNYSKKNNIDHKFSSIILNKKLGLLKSLNFVNEKNSVIFDKFPIKVSKIIDQINIHLIKQKYDLQSNIKIGTYSLNLNSREIFLKDISIDLTEKEIDILLFLNQSQKPQNIETLQKKVWNYSSDLETHTVETHIYRLRKKIKDTFNDDKFLLSSKEGYSIT